MVDNYIKFLSKICETHNKLYFVSNELKAKFPDRKIQFDLDMFSMDRTEYPESPVGITWEVNMVHGDKEAILFFELMNERNWTISAKRAIPGPETLQVFFDDQFLSLDDALDCLPKYVEQFKKHCFEQFGI